MALFSGKMHGSSNCDASSISRYYYDMSKMPECYLYSRYSKFKLNTWTASLFWVKAWYLTPDTESSD